ncbi:hypothetical protein EJ02DRAFT_461176 [Clathrospora elynae]|uniref:Uncharacterized protein n=1 Tax=Clathrospora elynae TaxID=706981 RepID=A0A6A5TA22_9PLEO|nr:hypothetical protein EJ02DRAFT_461176 [Clathrospora elynae]
MDLSTRRHISGSGSGSISTSTCPRTGAPRCYCQPKPGVETSYPGTRGAVKGNGRGRGRGRRKFVPVSVFSRFDPAISANDDEDDEDDGEQQQRQTMAESGRMAQKRQWKGRGSAILPHSTALLLRAARFGVRIRTCLRRRWWCLGSSFWRLLSLGVGNWVVMWMERGVGGFLRVDEDFSSEKVVSLWEDVLRGF